MNERIVKLFMQSVDSNYIPVPIEDHIPSWTEKFAELIVRECADVLDANGNTQYTITTVEPEAHSKSAEWREGYEEAVKQYGGFLLKKNAKQIKQHFGVEG